MPTTATGQAAAATGAGLTSPGDIKDIKLESLAYLRSRLLHHRQGTHSPGLAGHTLAWLDSSCQLQWHAAAAAAGDAAASYRWAEPYCVLCRSLGVYALPPLTHNGEEVGANLAGPRNRQHHCCFAEPHIVAAAKYCVCSCMSSNSYLPRLHQLMVWCRGTAVACQGHVTRAGAHGTEQL